MKPIDAWFKKKGYKGVNFQENLISYSTYSSNKTFNAIITNFDSLRYYASQMNIFLQAVARHIVKVYNMGVYRAIRAEQTDCLWEKRNSDDSNETTLPLSSRDKRIITCKSIADTHEKLARYGNLYRAFIETVTWIPVTTLIASPDS